MKKILAAILFLIFFAAGTAFAADPAITLSIDNTTLTENDTANLTVSVENMNNTDNLKLDGIADFEVVSTSKSTSVSIVNFKTTSVEELIYTIMPKRPGKFSLRVSARYKGKTVRSNTIVVDVGKGESQNNTSSATKVDDIFMQTKLSKTKAYYGEKLLLTYTMFTRYSLDDYGFMESPKFDNFIVKETEKNKLNANYTIIGGKKFARYEVARDILTPAAQGKCVIPSFKFQANAEVNDGFFGSTKPFYLRTDEKKVQILPLPGNKPGNFSGIVGKLNIASSISSKKVNYGDAITFKVKLYGDCNLDSIDKLAKDNISGFKIYQSQKSKTEEIRGGKYYAEADYEIVIIPEKGGNIVFPDINLSYFNTNSGKYEAAKIKGFSISVNGGKEQDTAALSQNGGEVIEVVKSVEPAKVDSEYFVLKINRKHAKASSILLGVLLLLAGGWYLIIYLRNRKDKEAGLLLSQLKGCSSDETVFDIFNSMLKQKLGISVKAIDSKEIARKIEDKELARKIIEVVQYVEHKRYGFAPEIDLKGKVMEIYDEIRKQK